MPAAKEEAKRPCPRARPCVGLRMRGAECASGKNSSPPMQTLQRRRCQTRARSRKKGCVYGVRVSGPTIFSYVGGNPLSYTDPEGLRPFPKPPSESKNQPDCDSNGCKVICLGAPGHYGVFCTTYHLTGGRWRTVNVEFIAWLGRPWSFIGTYSCEDFNNLKNPYMPNIN